jgi:beta-mannosidase
VHVHTSYDAPKASKGVVRWDLFHLDGRVLLSGRKRVILRPMTSVRQATLDLSAPLASFGRENLYLRVALDVAGRRASEDTVFLTIPRFMELPRTRTTAVVRAKGPGQAEVSFTSPVFQHKFEFDFAGRRFACSDNFFDLFPGETKRVDVTFPGGVTAADMRKSLVHRSLADTYWAPP